MLWQDGMVSGSALQITNWISIPYYIKIAEALVFLLGVTVVIERTVTGDFRLHRSYFSGPLLLILSAFFISWVRGMYMQQRVAIILEAHEAFSIPLLFYVVNNAFRDPEEAETLYKILLLAVIPKCLDGLYIWFFSPDTKKYWGVLELWRDGYDLAMGAIGSLLFLHYRAKKLRWLKRTMLFSIPLIGVTLMLSMRRTFVVSIMAAAVLMFVTLPKSYRKRQLMAFGGLLLGLIVFAIVTNPVAIVERFSGIVEPQGEGSAYIRLMELPNVLENIRNHPVLGVPVGIPWKVYYRMPVSAVYTTLGTHDAYLYWPLRAGVLGAIAFLWLFARLWKSVLLTYRLRRTEENFFFSQFSIQLLIIYLIASFFGLLYADDMPSLLAVVFTAIQLHARHITGMSSFREIKFWQSMREGKLVHKLSLIQRLKQGLKNLLWSAQHAV